MKKRLLALILCVLLAFSLLPLSALADEGGDEWDHSEDLWAEDLVEADAADEAGGPDEADAADEAEGPDEADAADEAEGPDEADAADEANAADEAEGPTEQDGSFQGGVITAFADLGDAAAVSTDYKYSLYELRKLFPAEITVLIDGGERSIAVEWACVENYDDDLDTFHFVPALEGYEPADGAELPVVTVTILGEFEIPPLPFIPDELELPDGSGFGPLYPEVPVTGALYSDDDIPATKGSLPATYNSYAQGKLPAVRNQNPYGTCWAHAAIGGMESDLIHDGAATTSVNLSELHLAYYAYHTFYDEKGLNTGDCAYATGTQHLDTGGNDLMAYRTLASMVGPALETAVPYSSASYYNPGASDGRSRNSGYQLAGAYHINTADKDAVKANIMAHGGVDASIYWDSNCYSATYNSFYTSVNPGGCNHDIMLVGWDDNFPASNFRTAAPDNGAWLVRNSWGTNGYSYGGYFWMSYYDKGFDSICTAFDTKNGQYDHCYSYDNSTFPGQRTIFVSGPATTRQVFENVAAGEQIAAVGVETLDTNLTLTIEVTCGSKTVTKTYKTTYAGYYLIPLGQPINVTTKSDATVRVTYAGADTIRIPAEWVLNNYSLWGITLNASCGSNGGSGMYIENTGSYVGNDSKVKLFTANTSSAPTISTQPKNYTGAIGETASFSVKASGNDLSYQWFWKPKTSGASAWKASNASGNKTAKLKVEITEARLGYEYRCVVTDKNGAMSASKAVHMVKSGPTITTQPKSVSVAEGKTASFKVVATGAKSYQWYVSKDGGSTWSAVSSGGTSATYTLTTAARHNGYKYKCKVSGESETVYSKVVTLTVLIPPAFTTHPKSVSVMAGDEASFTAAATGAKSYQWYVSKDGGSTWAAVSSGGTSATYRLTAAERHDGFKYKCAAKNAAGTVYSKVAALTVYTKPHITTQPKSTTVKAGEKATFKVSAMGVERYQWKYSKDGGKTWSDVASSSGKTAKLTFTTRAEHNGYKYKCVLENSYGKTTTSAVKLTVLCGPTITTQPVSVSVTPKRTATFTVVSADADSYQWYVSKDGGSTWSAVATSSGRSAALSVVATAGMNGYKYKCALSNDSGTTYSKAATLTVT